MDWLLFLFADAGFFLNEAVLWFQSKELTELLRIFWVMIFIEVPRYLLTDIYSLIRATVDKPRLEKLSELSPAGEPPLVSIIVSALNEERLIDEVIESLLHQDYPNFEIVVVDDGSQEEAQHTLFPAGRPAGQIRRPQLRHHSGQR
jgi:cellulose synthase/poly-beta-1,6-N-acetylglucosamine synthase-like glycosyltransferase